eukprot:405512_1
MSRPIEIEIIIFLLFIYRWIWPHKTFQTIMDKLIIIHGSMAYPKQHITYRRWLSLTKYPEGSKIFFIISGDNRKKRIQQMFNRLCDPSTKTITINSFADFIHEQGIDDKDPFKNKEEKWKHIEMLSNCIYEASKLGFALPENHYQQPMATQLKLEYGADVIAEFPIPVYKYHKALGKYGYLELVGFAPLRIDIDILVHRYVCQSANELKAKMDITKKDRSQAIKYTQRDGRPICTLTNWSTVKDNGTTFEIYTQQNNDMHLFQKSQTPYGHFLLHTTESQTPHGQKPQLLQTLEACQGDYSRLPAFDKPLPVYKYTKQNNDMGLFHKYQTPYGHCFLHLLPSSDKAHPIDFPAGFFFNHQMVSSIPPPISNNAAISPVQDITNTINMSKKKKIKIDHASDKHPSKTELFVNDKNKKNVSLKIFEFSNE